MLNDKNTLEGCKTIKIIDLKQLKCNLTDLKLQKYFIIDLKRHKKTL